jgi:hypothetical protein
MKSNTVYVLSSDRLVVSSDSSEAKLDRLWGGEDGIEKHTIPVSELVASVA